MRLLLQRLSHDSDSTIGALRVNGVDECYTVEDQPRKEKVQGETRIPAGVYKLKLRTVGGFHERMLAKYGPVFHKGMLWLQDVPGFQFILIHTGNTDKDTEGCIIVGQTVNPNGRGGGTLSNSRVAYDRLYPMVRDAVLRGEDVEIEVVDD